MDPFVFIIVVVSIVFGSIITLVKNNREHKAKHGAGLNDEETRIMQDLHQSLQKMEKRVEALETIIINKK